MGNTLEGNLLTGVCSPIFFLAISFVFFCLQFEWFLIGKCGEEFTSSPFLKYCACRCERILANQSTYLRIGWAKYMTWKYPVTVEITSNPAFKGAGAIEAAATL